MILVAFQPTHAQQRLEPECPCISNGQSSLQLGMHVVQRTVCDAFVCSSTLSHMFMLSCDMLFRIGKLMMFSVVSRARLSLRVHDQKHFYERTLHTVPYRLGMSSDFHFDTEGQ